MTEAVQRGGKAKGITRDAVAAAAAEACESVGIEQLSMRRVAVRLGVTPMALYNHVQGKDDLVDLVTQHVRSSIQVKDLPARERLVDLLLQLADLGTRYPRLVEAGVLADSSESALRLHLEQLRCLRELGLEPAEVRSAHNALLLLVFGGSALGRAALRTTAVADSRAHESALLDVADEQDRALLTAMAGLPRTTIARELEAAIDGVLDGALARK